MATATIPALITPGLARYAAGDVAAAIRHAGEHGLAFSVLNANVAPGGRS